jgi:Lon protease-like protein
VGRIVGHVELEDGTSHIVLEGLRRARVIKVKRKTPYPQLEIAPVVDEASTDLAGCTRDIARVLAFAENIVGELGEGAAPLMQRLRSLANQPGALADAAAGHLVAEAETRRALLECLSQDQRIKAVADELSRLDAQRKLDEQGGDEESRGLN